jgi:sporulation protein YlmC with PRC-barrel domain
MSLLACTPEEIFMRNLVLAIVLTVGQSAALAASAYALTQEEVVRELIGAPVYSTDGQEVGTVADISLDEDKLFDELLMNTSRSLGFGELTVRVPGSAFIALRGSVVLDLPAQSMDALVELGLQERPGER